MKASYLLLTGLLFFIGLSLYGQKDKKYIREGNREFANENFDKSELSYRKALEITKSPHKASFNVGDALYKQEKYNDAAKQFQQLTDSEIDKNDKSSMYHNLGNSLLQSSKLEESIEAYKDALRNNPDDLETKYNLAFAQDKLKQEQQQQQQDKDNKDQDQNKDKENKDNKDQQNKDQEDQNKKDQNQDQNKNNQDKKQQQQPQPNQISKEDAARILQALQNQEKEVQDKVKKAKASKAKVKTTINW